MAEPSKTGKDSGNWRSEQSGSTEQNETKTAGSGWHDLTGNWGSVNTSQNPKDSNDASSPAGPSEVREDSERRTSRAPSASHAPGGRQERDTSTTANDSNAPADYNRAYRKADRGGLSAADEARNGKSTKGHNGTNSPNPPMVLKRPSYGNSNNNGSNSNNNHSNNHGGKNQKGQNQRGPSTWAPSAWAEGSGYAGARYAEVARVTKETSINIILNLDGGELEAVPELVGERTNVHAFQSSPSQYVDIDTGIGFLDHMLHALAKHAGWSLYVKTKGDLYIDDHHTTEDTFLALGECVHKAMTWHKSAQLGLNRYGYAYAPLDEALSRAVVDLSARPYCVVELGFKREMIGQLSTEMITHAFQSFAQEARITLHVHCLHGDNDHHRAESAFKAMAVALRMALSKRAGVGANEMQSTKGVLY